jgi:hypothetical protein
MSQNEPKMPIPGIKHVVSYIYDTIIIKDFELLHQKSYLPLAKNFKEKQAK